MILIELGLEKRDGLPIAGERQYPDVGVGLRVDGDACDEVSIGRPALGKALKGGLEQAFLLADRANPLQIQVRWRVARRRETKLLASGDQMGVDS